MLQAALRADQKRRSKTCRAWVMWQTGRAKSKPCTQEFSPAGDKQLLLTQNTLRHCSSCRILCHPKLNVPPGSPVPARAVHAHPSAAASLLRLQPGPGSMQHI